MNQHELISAIHRHPEADQPRSDFADWLEGEGRTDHAEFIRADLELAQAERDDPAYDDIVARRRTSLERAQPEWWASITNVDQNSRRGLFRFRVGTRRTNRTAKPNAALGKADWLHTAYESGWLEYLDVWLDSANLAAVQKWGESARSVPLRARLVPTQLSPEHLDEALQLPQLRRLETRFTRNDDPFDYKSAPRLTVPPLSVATALEELEVESQPHDEPHHIDAFFGELSSLQHLRRVRIYDAAPDRVVTDVALIGLAGIASLERVSLVHTERLTPEAISAFERERPDVDVVVPYPLR